MRLDDFLSTVGVIKRRTIAKELAQNGMIEINGHAAKPAHEVAVADIIHVKGTHAVTVEVLAVPGGSVAKDQRDRYVRIIDK
jgi:ribosomal 50S subunit-recycling heat shock protein